MNTEVCDKHVNSFLCNTKLKGASVHCTTVLL